MNFKYNSFKQITFLIAILIASFPLYAQESSTMTTYLSASSLSPEEAILIGEEAYEDGAAFVRFNDADQLSSEGIHSYQLDGTGVAYNFEPTFYSQKDDGRFSTSGNINGRRFSLHFTPGVGYGGYGELNGHRIYFEPRGESLSRLVDGGVLSTPGEEGEPILICPEEDPEYHGVDGVRGAEHCDAIVDVLFLRSPESEQMFPLTGGVSTFRDFVDKVVDNTNETLQNTQIGSKTINPVFIDTTIDIGLDNCTVIGGMLESLRNNPVIQQLRAQYNADAVMYYHENPAVFGNKGGVAVAVGADYGSAFALNRISAELDFIQPYMVTTHELGHLFRGDHLYGHFWDVPQGPAENATVMATGAELTLGFDFIWHYSNPEVDYNYGTPMDPIFVPTGVLTSNDNAIRMTDHFCVVADLEQTGSFSSAVKDTRPFITPCFTIAPLCALTSTGNTGGPNSGPYTYEWKWSLSPSSTSSTVFSTEECVDFVPPIPSVTQYYVSLEVTDINTGNSALSSQYVNFHYCNDFAPLQSDQDNEQLLANESSELSITSTSAQISISFIDAEFKSVNATLYTLDGRVVAQQSSSADFVVSTHHLSSGLYNLKIVDNEGHLLTSTPIWHSH